MATATQVLPGIGMLLMMDTGTMQLGTLLRLWLLNTTATAMLLMLITDDGYSYDVGDHHSYRQWGWGDGNSYLMLITTAAVDDYSYADGSLL